MNKESLITLIYKDLYELKVLANGFSEMKIFPKSLVDLAVDKAKNIADCLQKLPLNADESQPPYLDFAQQPRTKSQEAETKSIEEKFDIFEETKIEKIFFTEQPKFEEQIEADILDEPIIEEKIEEKISKEPTIKEEIEEKIEIVEAKPEIIVEQLIVEEKIEPIIEKVEPKKDVSPTKPISQNKVSDLKQAFSIADRFRFQRELFDGNGERLSKALADLNEMETLEQAQNYIIKNLKFDLKNSVVQTFIEILKKKVF